jgi:hypothetical protein
MKTRNFLVVIVGLTLVIILKGLPWSTSTFGKVSDHQVYLALGFHMNLYHSYRGDTNDEAGFGKDIRIVRGILHTLDQANQRGIPVKAVWDMDNLYSLQTILPKYAPDIIDHLRRRVSDQGDEVMLMSYNNALASAENREELETSIQRAITNDAGSGIKDVFGRYSPIVRPQEMMTGPGSYEIYKEAGIRAMVLFHSAITFDAFRVFSRPLTRAEAFNPLLYHHDGTNEEMIVIPAYNIGDLVENGSLTEMIGRLRKEQIEGRIDRDVLVFIHFDADDQYWTGYDLPWYTSWMPNVGGLDALIDEVKNLDYVRFTTLADYLDSHEPVGRIEFGQDLADGNFNGYNSWAEKASSQIYWTAVEKDRQIHKAAGEVCRLLKLEKPPAELTALLDRSYESRLRLLSTTNYGMAAPYVAPARERVVENEIRTMAEVDEQIQRLLETLGRRYLKTSAPAKEPTGYRRLDSVLVLDDAVQSGLGAKSLTLDVNRAGVGRDETLVVRTPDGRLIRPVVTHAGRAADGSLAKVRLYVPAGSGLTTGVYDVLAGPAPETVPFGSRSYARADESILANEFIKVKFDTGGHVTTVDYHDRSVLGPESLLPAIYYQKDNGLHTYRPQKLRVIVEQDGSSGVAVVRLIGKLTMPDVPDSRPGDMDYRLTLIAGVPYLFLESALVYPQTSAHVTLSAGHPALSRKVDKNWISVAPAEIRPTLTADKDRPFRVVRQNYLGVASSYDIDYFRHSGKNLNLANINNHITDGYAAVIGREGGVAVAVDTSIFSSFAFCPLKMRYKEDSDRFTIRMNPFGTYFGPQYDQPTWGSGLGYRTALSVGGQYRSSAPSYNGAGQTFSLMLSFFEDQTIPEAVKNSLTAFAHPPQIITGGQIMAANIPHRLKASDRPPAGVLAGSSDKTIYFSWDRSAGPVQFYEVQCENVADGQTKVWTTTHASLEVENFDPGKEYHARVISVSPDGRKSSPSPELTFTAGQPFPDHTVKVPVNLQVRLMLAELF